MFGVSYSQIVTRPYVYGGGEFCGSSVVFDNTRVTRYSVFTRATEGECRALIEAFDVRSRSLDPFPGREAVLHCRQTDPYACERAVHLYNELADRFARGGLEETGPRAEAAKALTEFFNSDARLIVKVLFGFDPRRPLSLECADIMRLLDDNGHSTITATVCRDADHSWIVDVLWEEA